MWRMALEEAVLVVLEMWRMGGRDGAIGEGEMGTY